MRDSNGRLLSQIEELKKEILEKNGELLELVELRDQEIKKLKEENIGLSEKIKKLDDELDYLAAHSQEKELVKVEKETKLGELNQQI